LTAKARGETSADVTSAVPLSRTQLASLAATLKQKIGKTVTLNEHVDPSLIGGLQVKVGSQMIDSSLKTKLTAMKIAMKEVG
jgi:F-type H+-transporting ATPase subunit delta